MLPMAEMRTIPANIDSDDIVQSGQRNGFRQSYTDNNKVKEYSTTFRSQVSYRTASINFDNPAEISDDADIQEDPNTDGTVLNESRIDTRLSGVLTLLRRHSIDGTLCSSCSNDDKNKLKVKEVDKYALITVVTCTECNTDLSTKCYHGNWTRERIFDPKSLKRGDHICWHRMIGYWHHAIFLKLDEDDSKKIIMMEYDVDASGFKCGLLKCCSFHEGNVSMEASKDACCIKSALCNLYRQPSFLYRVNYEDCYTGKYVVERAKSLCGESQYDCLSRNCEHVARWCKTGIETSSQVKRCALLSGKIIVMQLARLLGLVCLVVVSAKYTNIAKNSGNGSSNNSTDLTQQALNELEIWVVMSIVLPYAMLFAFYIFYRDCRKVQSSSNFEVDDWFCMRRCIVYRCCCCICRIPRQLCGGRPPVVVVGMFLRIFVRECIAVVCPSLVFIFEENISSDHDIKDELGSRVPAAVFIAIAVSIAALAVGACIGRLVELIFVACSSFCCTDDCSKRSPGEADTPP